MFRSRYSVKSRSLVFSAISVAATLLITPGARATGFIVIDGGAGVPTLMPRIPIFHNPPPTTKPPAVLKGNVSFGLHLQSEEIKVDINDQVAKTYITQTFANDTDRNLAGTYLFPLPDDTTFSSFSLHIDGKPVEGKILEAQEARQQYEAIVRTLVDPGLLEYADYKTVRARIFPIPAHGTKKVELEYTQVLKADNGMLQYHFPLKAQGETPAVEEVKLDVKLNSKQGLRTIWSPSHEINVEKSSDNKAKVAYLAKNTVPEKDFVLYYSVSDKEMSANLVSHKLPGEDGFFLLTVTPPVTAPKVIGKDIVLIVDTSGSMQGDKIQQSKKALRYMIGALHPEDNFAILQFNTDVDAFKSKVLPATAENKKAAMAFIDDLEARGGTNIGDALHMGASMLAEESTRPAYILLMTDGEPTVGEQDVNKLVASANSKRDIRVFDVGVGFDVNTRLLNKLADSHHGTSQYVSPEENLETAMSSLYKKIQSPVLSNVKLTFDNVVVKDLYPREVKDIFAGSQVLLLGKYKEGAKGTVHLTGSVNGVSKSFNFPLKFEADETGNTYLPRLWAMRRIGHLTEVAQENHENREVIDEIVSLSKKYGIISAYTSFLVTDPSENHRLANNIPPAAMPMGMPTSVRGTMMHAPRQVQLREDRSSTVSDLRRAQSSGMRFDYAPNEFALQSAALHKGKAAGGGGAAMVPPAPLMSSSYASAGAKSLGSRGSDDEMKAMAYQNFKKTSSSSNGQDAFVRARENNTLKDSIVANQLDSNSNKSMKTVEDKTFYLQNGIWTDSTFVDKDLAKAHTVAFGSDAYFKLLHEVPALAKYLAIGKQVIVIFKGQCYQITASFA
ncbi:MAG: VIT and VWA domain-containing protein [Candidatus Obscuribacterales bacterium]|nr:VIT and VWA domain-containing protein [Candidatus Obscuribacterales bacterium]